MKKLSFQASSPSATLFGPLWALLFLLPFLGGGFYEPVSCLCSIFLLGYLWFCWKKTGSLSLPKDWMLFALAAMAACFGVSALWAIDHGMALLGFVKFLSVLLFGISLKQLSEEERRYLLTAIPASGAAMVLLSLALGCVPLLHGYFYVNGRLGGFFQYPNTFALYLLAGVVLAWGRKKGMAVLPVLLVGIALSGSRTVFFLLMGALLLLGIFASEKKWRNLTLALLVVFIAGTAAYAILSGNFSTVGRYLTSSLNSSTLLGRLLYARDALPIILRHPFGMGYLGYYYTQGKFQTGVYSVRNIHNELLQLLLDIGWLPTVLLVAATIRKIFFEEKGLARRMLPIVICLHCLVDFDLQFLAVDFLLILTLEQGDSVKVAAQARAQTAAKSQSLGQNIEPWQDPKQKRNPMELGYFAISCLLLAMNLWLGLASMLFYVGKSEAAVSIYPGYTEARVQLLTRAEDMDALGSQADKILWWNDCVSLAHSAKARVAFADGDFTEVIRQKQEAIALSRYDLEEYLEYFDMLCVGIQLYEEAGDAHSAAYCRERLFEVPDMLKEVLDGTSSLGWRIKDKPELELPEQYLAVLESLGWESD